MGRKRTEFFSWRQAVLRSTLPMPTKCLLLVLACHMNDAGEQCFPSIEILMREASMGRTAVIKHIKVAVSAGWLEVTKHGFGGQRWARNEYHMRWPEEPEGGSRGELPSVPEPPQGGSRREPPSPKKAVHVATKGGSRRDQKAVRQVNSSTPVNSPLPHQVFGLDVNAWERWVQYRQRKRNKLRPESLEAAMRQMAALGPQQMAAVEHSIANGYTGLYAPTGSGARQGGRKTADDYNRELSRKIEEATRRDAGEAIPGTCERVD